jgi:cell division control protein 6
MCALSGYTVLTERRVTELISELDMLGIIEARVVSFGKYGRTKEIKAGSQRDEILASLSRDTSFSELLNAKGKQKKLDSL